MTIASDGEYERLGPELKKTIDAETKRLLEESQQRARGILMKNIAHLHALAAALLEQETMNKDAIIELLEKNGATVPNAARGSSTGSRTSYAPTGMGSAGSCLDVFDAPSLYCHN